MLMIIFILLAYGITNIVVSGSIFDGAKAYVWKYRDVVLKSNTVSDEDILESKKYGVPDEMVKEYYDAIQSFSHDTSSVSLGYALEQAKKNILDIIKSKKVKWYKSFVIWLTAKSQSLLICYVCTGFWVGFILSQVSIYYPVTLLGIKTAFATSTLASFYAGCISSATSGIISYISGAIYNLKNKLEG